MENFKINNRVYEAKEITFRFVNNLEKNGISVENMTGFAATTCYIAWCMNVPFNVAEELINQHVINGGKISDFVNVYVKMIEKSDFFRALMGTETDPEQTTETETDQNTKTSSKKTTKTTK